MSDHSGNPLWVSIVAVLIALASLALSAVNVALQHRWEGHVDVSPPSGCGVIRGIETIPSDHLFMPLVWSNTGRKARLIRNIELKLVPLREGNEIANQSIRFLLAGEYEKMAPDLIGKELSVIHSSILVPAVSTQERVLVFHIENWWDPQSPTFEFRFHPGEEYAVYIKYSIDVDPEVRHKRLFDFEVCSGVGSLKRYLPGWAAGPSGPPPTWEYCDFAGS